MQKRPGSLAAAFETRGAETHVRPDLQAGDKGAAAPQPMTSGQSVWNISPRGLSVRS